MCHSFTFVHFQLGIQSITLREETDEGGGVSRGTHRPALHSVSARSRGARPEHPHGRYAHASYRAASQELPANGGI